MKFEALYERYRAGTATPEEVAQVEEELAKFRLLTDYVAEHDELDLPELPAQAEAGEYRAVKKRARRTRRQTVGLAVAITCAVLLAARLVLWPLLNTFCFYNPERENLEQAMAVYSSLFFPTSPIYAVGAENTGLGRWDVTLRMVDQNRPYGGQDRSVQGTVEGWNLHFYEPLSQAFSVVNQFKPGDEPDSERYYPGQAPAQAADKLLELPDYTQAVLCLSFARDLSMDELAALEAEHPAVFLQWVKVRTLEGAGFLLPLTGFAPEFFIADAGDDTGERYPWLFQQDHKDDPDRGAFYENHFKDLLRYMMDQDETVWGLYGAEHYQYQRALDHVEEHGVLAQGVYVSGRPADLAALCGEEVVAWASLDSIRLYPDMK